MEDKSQALDMPASGPPGRCRSRRRLNVSPPPKVQKSVRSPPKKKKVNFASVTVSSQDSELSASCSFDSSHGGGGGSTLNRRLTRSASKRWLKVYESSGPMLQNETSVASTSMLPPPQPTVPLIRATTCSVTTRLRDSNSRNGSTDVNRISQNFFKRLSFDQISNTSDYGTASEHSRKCSVASGGMSPVSDSGHSCASISGIESLGTSSCDEATPPNVSAMEWVHQPWVGDSAVLQKPHVTVHTVEGVTAFIPDVNQSQYTGDFSVTIKSDVDGVKMYRPPICSSLRVHHISPIVSMGPHGVQFHENLPVMLVLPLSIEPSDEEWISCLYSNTEAGCQPCWERLPRKDYSYRNGSVVITTNHFSLFTVVLEEPYPEVMKRIRRRTGGRLLLNEVPGVEVVFPHGSLDQDLDAYLRVLYNQEPMLNSSEEVAHIHGALASPVIMLGPHGHAFSTRREPVRIKLPIPHYHEIRARFGNVGLTVWQSSTSEGEATCWQRMESSLLQIEPPVAGLSVVVVSFAVHHFSFFKVVWDLLSTSLTEAKMGMSYFYPYISFSMMCQAFMEESNEARFGLEVICYRSDKTLPEQTNYRHRVGASTKPKLVRPGRILVRLKSQMFEADIDAGEDAAMSKEEPDFRGRDFEKQYACRFKQNVNIESGTFGKVIVERVATTGAKNDPLFEFNLNKSDAGHEVLQPMGSERWTAFAMKELASTLQITEGHNWKKFAQHIGFTKSEIKTKFQYSPDPFLAIMNLYGSRGGTPEEFMQALYAVSRDLNLNAGMSGSLSDMGSSSQSSTGSKGSGSRDSGSRHSRGSGNRFGGLWGYRPWGQVNNDSDSDSMPADAKEGARKRSHPSLEKKNSGGSSSAKRRKFSDVSETVSSGSEGDEDNSDQEAEKSNNRHIKNKRRLSDKDMWRISTGIARKDWRFLGRTLGIEERVLVDLEHQYQPVGFRECAYQMLLEWKGCKPRKCTFGNLYSALIRENMVEIAKHMVKILPNGEEDARERDFNDQ